MNYCALEDYDKAYNLLLKTYENVLAFSKNRQYETILLPALGTGHYGFEHEKTAGDLM